MEEIRRVGAARAVDARGSHISVAVSLSASPPPEWVHFFREFPSEYSSMCHPKLVEIEDKELVFTSSENHFADWIRYIDRWIGDANAKYAEYIASLRKNHEQREQEKLERNRRLQQASEKLRGL